MRARPLYFKLNARRLFLAAFENGQLGQWPWVSQSLERYMCPSSISIFAINRWGRWQMHTLSVAGVDRGFCKGATAILCERSVVWSSGKAWVLLSFGTRIMSHSSFSAAGLPAALAIKISLDWLRSCCRWIFSRSFWNPSSASCCCLNFNCMDSCDRWKSCRIAWLLSWIMCAVTSEWDRTRWAVVSTLPCKTCSRSWILVIGVPTASIFDWMREIWEAWLCEADSMAVSLFVLSPEISLPIC